MWITGLAGAGKTTVAQRLSYRLRSEGTSLVNVDGDRVRDVMGDKLGYTDEERLVNAYRVSRFCRLIQREGVMVVCSTMSLYPEIWAWNREHLHSYVEVYLRVSEDILRVRDKNGLYSGVVRGDVENVVGMDRTFHEPTNPALVLTNERIMDLDGNVQAILECLGDSI